MKAPDKKELVSLILKAIHNVQKDGDYYSTNKRIADLLGISIEQWIFAFQQWSDIQTSNPIPFLQMKHLPQLLSKSPNSLWKPQIGQPSSNRLAVMQQGPMHMCKEKIHYDLYDSWFGPTLIASDSYGICLLEFIQPDRTLEMIMNSRYQGLEWKRHKLPIHELATEALEDKALGLLPISLYGTHFQLQVWNELINLPQNVLTTYKSMAEALGDTKKSRAVGQTIGKNPIAYLIPCHRVIHSNGHSGHYLWGESLKKALILYDITFF